jgi:hypothetical protein
LNKSLSLIAPLTDSPRFFLQEIVEDADIVLEGKTFTESGLGASIGFYDWLRRSDGSLVGVRTWLSQESEIHKFRNQLVKCSRIEWGKNHFILFFSDKRDFEDKLSDDQELGAHRLAISADGVALLTYDVALLSKEEMLSLKSFVERVA